MPTIIDLSMATGGYRLLKRRSYGGKTISWILIRSVVWAFWLFAILVYELGVMAHIGFLVTI